MHRQSRCGSGAVAAAGMVALLCGSRRGCGARRRRSSRTPEERFSYARRSEARRGPAARAATRSIASSCCAASRTDSRATSRSRSSEIAAALAEGVEAQREQREALHAERARGRAGEGRAFLERNRSRAGVVELPSGLQYEVLRRRATDACRAIEDFVTCQLPRHAARRDGLRRHGDARPAAHASRSRA